MYESEIAKADLQMVGTDGTVSGEIEALQRQMEMVTKGIESLSMRLESVLAPDPRVEAVPRTDDDGSDESTAVRCLSLIRAEARRASDRLANLERRCRV